MNKPDEIEFTQDINNLLTSNPRFINRIINNEADMAFIRAFHDYGYTAKDKMRTWILSRKIPEGCTPAGSMALNAGRLGAEGFTLATILDRLRQELEFSAVDGPPAIHRKGKMVHRFPKPSVSFAATDSTDPGPLIPALERQLPPRDTAAASPEATPAQPKQHRSSRKSKPSARGKSHATSRSSRRKAKAGKS